MCCHNLNNYNTYNLSQIIENTEIIDLTYISDENGYEDMPGLINLNEDEDMPELITRDQSLLDIDEYVQYDDLYQLMVEIDDMNE